MNIPKFIIDRIAFIESKGCDKGIVDCPACRNELKLLRDIVRRSVERANV